MQFNSPLSLKRATYLVEKLELASQQVVVDLGCGNGGFLHHLASQIPIIGYGVDNNDVLITEAQSNWDNDKQQSKLEFISADAKSYIETMTPVDAIVCIGAEYIFGGYSDLLKILKPVLKPKGKALIGTIYWKQAPTSDYLALMNGENPHHDLHTTVNMAYQSGYLPLDVGRANNDEWDRFESYTARKHYAKPNEIESTWAWQEGYLKWGLNTMGFCFLLLEKTS